MIEFPLKNSLFILMTVLKIIHREINIYLIILINSTLVFFISLLQKHYLLSLYNEIVIFTVIYNISFIITDLFFESDKLFFPYRVYPISLLILQLLKNIFVVIIYFLFIIVQLLITNYLFHFSAIDIQISVKFSVFILPPILVYANVYSIKKQINPTLPNIIKNTFMFLTLLIPSLFYLTIIRTFQNNLPIFMLSFLFTLFTCSIITIKFVRSYYSRGAFYV